MQKCKRCGLDLSADIRVCPYCGYPVEPEDEEQRRRLMLRWHLGALLPGLKRPARGFPFSPAHPITTSGQQLPVAIIVFLASVLILVNIILVGSFGPHNVPPTPTPITFTFPPHLSVTPTFLDFGPVQVGRQAVQPVMIKTSSESQLRWKIVSGNAQWLSITLSRDIKEPGNLREVIYDVTANTSKLKEGQYAVILAINAGGGKDQQLHVKIQVVPPGSSLPPAKLNVNPLLLDFGSQNVGSQKTLPLMVSNSGQMDLNWMADRGKTTWLTLDTNGGKIAAGGLPQVITVKVDTTTLTPGQHSAMINFTSNGGNASVNVVLTVISTPTPGIGPTVSNISPMNGPATGGTSVTITGSGFTRATSVSFGPTTTGNFKVDSDTQITVVSTAGSGIVDVTVTTPNGTSATSSADLFTYNRLMVTAIDPMSGPATGGTSVTITGTGFTSAASVSFGSTLASNITFISDTRITAVSPSGCGIVHVTVTTPSGTSATGTADLFTYIPPTPTVVYIKPYRGPTTGGTSVIITGSGFMCATSVKFGSTPARKYNIDNDTQITAISPPGDGIVDVTVTTSSGTSAMTYDDQFDYIPPPPTVRGIDPNNGPATGGTSVTITGTGFTSAASVLFGSTPASGITVISDTQITAISPPGCGIADVTVSTPNGTSAKSKADLFTYNPSTPTVAYIEPYSGPTTGGTSVIITGSGFMCASSVKFGSIATSDFKVDSDTQITVVSPPGDGTVDVTVITPSGTSATTYDDQFTYHPPICVYCRFLAYHPIVADISPTSGFYRIGTTVTIARSGIVNLM